MSNLTTPLLPLSTSFGGQKPSNSEPNIFQKSVAKAARVFGACAAASEEAPVAGDTCVVCNRDFVDEDKVVVLANKLHRQCADDIHSKVKEIFYTVYDTETGRKNALDEFINTYQANGLAALEARNSKLGICVLL